MEPVPKDKDLVLETENLLSYQEEEDDINKKFYKIETTLKKKEYEKIYKVFSDDTIISYDELIRNLEEKADYCFDKASGEKYFLFDFDFQSGDVGVDRLQGKQVNLMAQRTDSSENSEQKGLFLELLTNQNNNMCLIIKINLNNDIEIFEHCYNNNEELLVDYFKRLISSYHFFHGESQGITVDELKNYRYEENPQIFGPIINTFDPSNPIPFDYYESIGSFYWDSGAWINLQYYGYTIKSLIEYMNQYPGYFFLDKNDQAVDDGDRQLEMLFQVLTDDVFKIGVLFDQTYQDCYFNESTDKFFSVNNLAKFIYYPFNTINSYNNESSGDSVVAYDFNNPTLSLTKIAQLLNKDNNDTIYNSSITSNEISFEITDLCSVKCKDLNTTFGDNNISYRNLCNSIINRFKQVDGFNIIRKTWTYYLHDVLMSNILFHLCIPRYYYDDSKGFIEVTPKANMEVIEELRTTEQKITTTTTIPFETSKVVIFMKDEKDPLRDNKQGPYIEFPKFKVDSNGILEATDGIFNGSITSTEGYIGGFQIGENYLQTGDRETYFIDGQINISGISDWIQNPDGSVYATRLIQFDKPYNSVEIYTNNPPASRIIPEVVANIVDDGYAIYFSIGHTKMENFSFIYRAAYSSKYGVGMSAEISSGSPAFWAGYTGTKPNLWEGDAIASQWKQDTKFYVTNQGKLVAKNAEIKEEGWIGGLQINSNGLFSNNSDGSEKLSLTPNGLIIPSTGAKIQVGNFQTYYDSTQKKTYWITDGPLYIQGTQSGNVISAIELLTNPGTMSQSVTFKLQVRVTDAKIYMKIISTPTSLYYNETFTIFVQGGSGYHKDGLFDKDKSWHWHSLEDYNKDNRFIGPGTRSLTISSGEGEKYIDLYDTWPMNPALRFSMNPDMSNPSEGYDVYYNYTDGSIVQPLTLKTGTQTMANNTISITGNLAPSKDNTYSLGQSNSSGRWTVVYATTSTINTSDENKKNSIQLLEEPYDTFFNQIQPVKYKFNDGTSNRYHTGFISQKIKNALDNSGLTDLDFAGYVDCSKDGVGDGYGLRYSEFIALNTWQIQKLKHRVNELETQVKNLEIQIDKLKYS
jgi:hypothetical protein